MASFHTVFIALGSNVGDRRANIERAIEELKLCPSIKVMKVSRLYETEPVGGPPQDKFLDGVAEIKTSFTPNELLAALKDIEKKVGRTLSGIRWGPREIDLDIILFGDSIINEPDLTIPHPFLHERAFMLEPLCEIAPNAMHPVLKKTASELLLALGP